MIRHSAKGLWKKAPAESSKGKLTRKTPSRKISSERTAIFFRRPAVPARREKENQHETPERKRKSGKMQSVGVSPCQAEWFIGQKRAFQNAPSGFSKIPQSPGLLTRTMAAIVRPRRASIARTRLGLGVGRASDMPPIIGYGGSWPSSGAGCYVGRR